MQPFLRWAGGKRWLVSRLSQKIPPFKTYYEPFLGSGAVFFSIRPKNAILSDSNPELINCFKCVRNHCGSVMGVLDKLEVSTSMYYKIRDTLYHRADSVRRAAYFIYLNRTCWNGLYRVNRQGRFNVPAGEVSRVKELYNRQQLITASELLKKAKLRCCDFEVALKTAESGDFVYCDPPYITTHLDNGFIKYNSKLFCEVDELRLAKMGRTLVDSRVSVLISNASHPLIRQLYDGPFYKTEVVRSSLIAADSRKRTKFAEILISNFAIRI